MSAQTMLRALGLGEGSGFARAFAALDIATEEIARFERAHGKGRRISAALFKATCPSPFFNGGYHEQVFRHHVRELLERALRGEQMHLGTDAEALLAMREASLASPLNRDGEAVFHHLFRTVMGERAYRETCGNHVPPDRGEGRLAELLHEARTNVARGTGRPIPPVPVWKDDK